MPKKTAFLLCGMLESILYQELRDGLHFVLILSPRSLNGKLFVGLILSLRPKRQTQTTTTLRTLVFRNASLSNGFSSFTATSQLTHHPACFDRNLFQSRLLKNTYLQSGSLPSSDARQRAYLATLLQTASLHHQYSHLAFRPTFEIGATSHLNDSNLNTLPLPNVLNLRKRFRAPVSTAA